MKVLPTLIGALVAWMLACAAPSSAQQVAAVLQRVGFDQRLGEQVPPELSFRDHRGRRVELGDYVGQRPVILALVYYQCPMLCTLELNGLVKSLKSLDLDPVRDYELVVVSFDPRDTPALAAAKRTAYLQQFGRDDAGDGWHFLTGNKCEIERLCRAVGFRYDFDPQTGLYAHASGIVVLTPAGRIARYFYGIDYPPRDLRLGLVEASHGAVGSPADQFLLLCYHYDPTTGRYGLTILNIIRAAGAITVLAIGGFVIFAVRRERARRQRSDSGQGNPTYEQE